MKQTYYIHACVCCYWDDRSLRQNPSSMTAYQWWAYELATDDRHLWWVARFAVISGASGSLIDLSSKHMQGGCIYTSMCIYMLLSLDTLKRGREMNMAHVYNLHVLTDELIKRQIALQSWSLQLITDSFLLACISEPFLNYFENKGQNIFILLWLIILNNRRNHNLLLREIFLKVSGNTEQRCSYNLGTL